MEPNQGYVCYEIGSSDNGCYYHKCANGYAWLLANYSCTQGHRSTRSWASGWPQCPHGYPYSGTDTKDAHCYNDSGWQTPGYRAPCEKQLQETMHILTIYLNNK